MSYRHNFLVDDILTVVKTFSCVLSNIILQLSWSCQENQVSGALNSMSLYGIGKSLLEKRRRGASQL